MTAQARTPRTRKSLATRLLPSLALLAFASLGTACDLTSMLPVTMPGASPHMDLAAPAPVVPCDPKPGAWR